MQLDSAGGVATGTAGGKPSSLQKWCSAPQPLTIETHTGQRMRAHERGGIIGTPIVPACLVPTLSRRERQHASVSRAGATSPRPKQVGRGVGSCSSLLQAIHLSQTTGQRALAKTCPTRSRAHRRRLRAATKGAAHAKQVALPGAKTPWSSAVVKCQSAPPSPAASGPTA